jgi:hypothetical protein
MADALGASGSKISSTVQGTFTMLELSDIADCNALRAYLIKKGLKDLSPKTKNSVTVSFNGAIALSNGADFISRLQNIPADWLVLSGHHGILYGSDYNLFGDPTNNRNDLINCYNNNKYAGFFNNEYHSGRWDNASRKSPDTAKKPAELYCSTTDYAPASIAPFPQTNPYIPGNTLKTRCKGIILSACNSLSYKSVRSKWVQSFPNAVIFGTFARIPMGLYVIKALMTAPSTTKDFWLNPQSVLNASSDMPKKIAGEVFAIGSNWGISVGMIYNNKAYFGPGTAGDSVQIQPFDFHYT